MKNENLTKQFVESLLKINFFIRPHHWETRKVPEEIQNADGEVIFKEGQKITLQVLHFSTLELIYLLTQINEICRRDDVIKIQKWRLHGKQSSMDKTILPQLEALKLIQKSFVPRSGKLKAFELTDEGKKLVADLLENRREFAQELTSLLKLDGEDAIQNFLNKFNPFAEEIWKNIQIKKAEKHSPAYQRKSARSDLTKTKSRNPGGGCNG